MAKELKFCIGQVVHHKRFKYRGVIYDVDPRFQGTDTWYEQVAKSRPPKDKPWYKVLVDGTEYETYVSERHLELVDEVKPVEHPLLKDKFIDFRDGLYTMVMH